MKGVIGIRENVNDHRSDEHELALDDEDERLQAIDRCDKDDRDEREWRAVCGHGDDEVHQVHDSRRENLDASSSVWP